MPLFLVARQLLLWPSMFGPDDPSPSDYSDDGRGTRTGREWLESIRDYCLWRAGSNWRRISSKKQRQSVDRWWYLNGCRAINDLLAGAVAEPKRPHIALPVLNPRPAASPEERKLA